MCNCDCLFRLVELNCRLLGGLSVREFSDLVTSSDDLELLCRVVVLRESVETGDESSSLSHDISQW